MYPLQKSYCTLLAFFILSPLAFAGNNTPIFTNNAAEEKECFVQLNKKIKNDQRFMNNDTDVIFPERNLTKVLLDEKNHSYVDLSNFDEFMSNAAINPLYSIESWREGELLIPTDFLLRRGHVGTVLLKEDYIISTITGFGRDSNFTFPLNPPEWGLSEGDPYTLGSSVFKEFLAYTHHSIKGDFLSCGIIKITPLNGRLFWDISESAYQTNILNGMSDQANLSDKKCASGFEGTDVTAGGKKFYSMKTNICTFDYADKDFVKMELISLAYDNGSSWFNEYPIFQLQVEAMSNPDWRSKGLGGIRDGFLSYLDTRTCLQAVHVIDKYSEAKDLPAECSNMYSADILALVSGKIEHLAYSVIDSIKSFLFSETHAARELNIPQEKIDNAQGMVVYNNFPYELYKKLLLIENKNFVDFINIALTPNFETYILTRKEQNIVPSPYEEVFLQCNISHVEREKIVADFLQKLPDPKKLDLSNLTYSNPRFGDCIIPYPDKRNLSKVVPDSFESNKLLAEQLNGTYKWPPVSQNIQNMIVAQNTLHAEYQKKVDAFTRDFNEWRLSSDELSQKIEEEKKNLDISLQEVLSQANISDLVEESSKGLSTGGMINDGMDKKTAQITLYLGILLLLWGVAVVFWIMKRK